MNNVCVLIHGMVYDYERKIKTYKNLIDRKYDIFWYAPNYLVDNLFTNDYKYPIKIKDIKYYNENELYELYEKNITGFKSIENFYKIKDKNFKKYDIQMRLNDIIFQHEFRKISKKYNKIIIISSSWFNFSKIYQIENNVYEGNIFDLNNWYVYDRTIEGANSIWSTDSKTYDEIIDVYINNFKYLMLDNYDEMVKKVENVIDSHTKKNKNKDHRDYDIERVRKKIFSMFDLTPIVCACVKSKFRICNDKMYQ